MRVLVTGAAGWSGSAVVGALLEAGHAVVAHDLPRSWEAERERAASDDTPAWEVPVPVHVDSHCMRVEGDLLVAASVRSAVQGCDAVIHTAVLHPPAAETVGGEDEVSRLTFLVQANGLFNLLDAIKDTPSVQRFVHVSSCWTAHVSFFVGTAPCYFSWCFASMFSQLRNDFRGLTRFGLGHSRTWSSLTRLRGVLTGRSTLLANVYRRKYVSSTTRRMDFRL